MLLTPTLSRQPEKNPALDQQQLYAIGLDHVRRLSRRLWTDHNLHDPGITTLELLCYAITDLSYRAQFPLEDLLASKTDNARNMAEQFFKPRQVLPNSALTERDYRKLLIDLKDVKNAWLLPASQTLYADTIQGKLLTQDPGLAGIQAVTLQGLFKVLLEFDDDVTTQAREQEIYAEAMALLQANRSLCTDFVAIDKVRDQYYILCAEIDLMPQADQVEVAARIRFEVEQYLTPPVLNSTLSAMLARRHTDGTPYTVAEIFDGPLLRHGFIDDAELDAAELRTDIRLSDIIHKIMHIDGVLAVRDIVINPLTPGNDPDDAATSPADKWLLPVPVDRQPRLSDTQGRLVFYKRDVPVPTKEALVKTAVEALHAALDSKLEAPMTDEELDAALPIPLGRDRDVASFHSFQHHFPELYGLSDVGLPPSTSALRHAQALQLKAYLLFFDQAMANYFAQLAHLRDLFSRDPSVKKTYFAQRVDSFPDAEKIYLPGVTADTLQAMLEDGPGALARRNRFLDHLLARFAEEFHHYAAIMHSAFGVSTDASTAAKCNFLNDYPTLGAERGLAYNATLQKPEALWNTTNVSGLERRIARLLAMPNFTRRNLGAVAYNLYAEIDTTPGDEFRFRIKHPVSGKILLSSSTHYASQAEAQAELNLAIERAQQPDAYERKLSVDGKHYFNVLDGEGHVIARRIEYFSTAEAMNAAIESLITQMRQYFGDDFSDEGMYLIENILLRPTQAGDPLLDICVDSNCSDCADLDPYSFRLHVILPAYARRFLNMDFRRFVEETIRTECPAHLLPKVCWVNASDMARIEQAYRDWLGVVSGATTADRVAKIQALIEALEHAKNVYPTELLRDCGSDLDKPPIILGRTALGSETTILPSVTPPK